MTNNTATPRPWSTDADRNGRRSMIHCDTEYLQGQLIAMSPINTTENIEQHKADMKHIVKCVNMHEKLIEALRSAVDALEGFGCEDVPYYDNVLREVE